MSYQIVLSPDLSVSAAEFTAAWNETPNSRAIGEAHLLPTKDATFDPALGTAIVTVLSSLAVSIAGNLFFEAIKDTLTRKGETREIVIREIPLPDGTLLRVVKIKE